MSTRDDTPALTPDEAHAEERRRFDVDASNEFWQNVRDFYAITTNATADHLRVADYAHDLINSMVRLARVRGLELEGPPMKRGAERVLEAIVARIHGEWDNPALVEVGPLLVDTEADILNMIKRWRRET